MGQQTNLGIAPNPVGISCRGYLEFVAFNLHKLVNIISDEGRFEAIQLSIILEDAGEEGYVLWARMSLNRFDVKQNNIHHQ